MLHNVLPMRPHPRALNHDSYPTSLTLPKAKSAAIGMQQGRATSHPFAYLHSKEAGRPQPSTENTKSEASAANNITETGHRFDPADPETWSAKPPPFLLNGGLYPTGPKQPFWEHHSGDNSLEEQTD
ncbi:Fc.00g087560.m01.CDS01 [Cosmosporella sp. VM-42]